jgi:hypothetical protein
MTQDGHLELLSSPTASHYPTASPSAMYTVPIAAGLFAIIGWGATVGFVHAPEAADAGWTTIPVRASSTSNTSRSALTLADRVQQLKDESGLSWTQVASLFGVTRRAVHFWVRGGNITDEHVVRLERLQSATSAIAMSSPRETRARMLSLDMSGASIFGRLLAETTRQFTPASSPVDLLEANPESSYIQSEVVGGQPVDLDLREL